MRTKTGVITSNKMMKTIVVTVTTDKLHPKYKKRFKVSKKFYAHCEDSSKYPEGSTVTIAETRPLSKLKRWKVIETPEAK
ncbi:30S ribosomal protein S17 [Candidatus Peregrinibacteria bacterium]|nr:30S ribosomal protein S17 [Candidatus Peregrinibacteria bacterium]